MLGIFNTEINKRVKDLLELVEIKTKSMLSLESLVAAKAKSGYCQSSYHNPKLLLCDEATSALDPSITTSILQLLKQINQELKVTIVVVTHQMNVVKQVCNNMGYFK